MKRRSFLSILSSVFLAPFVAIRPVKAAKPVSCKHNIYPNKHDWALAPPIVTGDLTMVEGIVRVTARHSPYPDKPFIKVIKYATDGSPELPIVLPDLFRRCRRCGVQYGDIRQSDGPLIGYWEQHFCNIPWRDCGHLYKVKGRVTGESDETT